MFPTIVFCGDAECFQDLSSCPQRPNGPPDTIPPLLPEWPYCTMRSMETTALIPIAFLVAGSIAVILTVYMYR